MNQLAEQNNLKAWLDCNDARRPHLWRRGYFAGDWVCARCPVATRKREGKPSAYLYSSQRRARELRGFTG